ncbi:MAG: DUF2608 domain-containing protein [Chlamydiales bacterium]
MTRFFFSLLFTLLASSVFGKIIEANSLEEVKKWVGCPDAKTLVIFDVDLTLITPLCPAYQYNNVVCYKSVLSRMGWSEDEKKVAINLADLSYKIKLVEPGSVVFIHSLQQQKIPTIALTSVMTGELGKIKDVLSRRKQQLLLFDIDFSKTAPYLPRFQLDNLAPFLGTYPEGASGIICANNQPKGAVLKSFLKLIDWMPEKVVLIDDMIENLESMEKSTQNLGIDFTGIHYLAKKYLVDGPIDADAFYSLWLKLKKEAVEIIKKRYPFSEGNEHLKS